MTARSFRLPLGELSVRGVRLRAGEPELRVVEAVIFLRIAVEKAPAQNLLRRILPLLIIKPVRAAEIGDAALRRDARTAEKHDITAAVHELFELPDLLGHSPRRLSSCIF